MYRNQICASDRRIRKKSEKIIAYAAGVVLCIRHTDACTHLPRLRSGRVWPLAPASTALPSSDRALHSALKIAAVRQVVHARKAKRYVRTAKY